MEVDSSLDPELVMVSKKYSTQKQLIAQLQTENRSLHQLVHSLRSQLHQLQTQQQTPPPQTATAAASSPVATEPIIPITTTPESSKSTAAAVSPAASLDTQPLPSPRSPAQTPQLPAAAAAASPPTPQITVSYPIARVTRSQTRLTSGAAAPAPPPPATPLVERQVSLPSSNDRLLDELLQADQLKPREEGKRKRKMSVADRAQAQAQLQAEKRLAREETKERDSPSAVDPIDAVVARAEAEYERGKAVKDSDPTAAAAHFREALQSLSTLPSPSSNLPMAVRHLYAGLYYSLAVLSSGQSKREEAKELIQQALQWRGDWHKAWRGLANVEANLKRYDLALEAYDRALQCPLAEGERLVIERLRRISEQAMRSSPQPFLNTPRSGIPSQLSPSTSPTKPTRETVQSGRSLGARLDQADFAGRRVLGDITNVRGGAGTSPGPAAEGEAPLSQPIARNRQGLLRLPVITKEGVRDLLGSERFALAGVLDECKALLKWKCEGLTVEGQTRDTSRRAKGTKTFLEQACTFDSDRVVEYHCDCMKRREREDGAAQADDGHRRAQEMVQVRDADGRCWRYGACEHIGALLLAIGSVQKTVDAAPSSLTRPHLFVHSVHRPSADQMAIGDEAMGRQETQTVDALRAELKRNQTRTTGLKVELVMRCVEGEVWGVAERCAECRLGYQYYSGGVWRCRGWFDKDKRTHMPCDNIITQPRMHPWMRI